MRQNLSVNDCVIKAVASALRIVPDANVTWTDTAMRRHKAADIAMTARARSGGPSPCKYKGGSVSVSNLGVYGVEEFSAIKPPHSCIFVVGGHGKAGGERWRRRGAVAVRFQIFH